MVISSLDEAFPNFDILREEGKSVKEEGRRVYTINKDERNEAYVVRV